MNVPYTVDFNSIFSRCDQSKYQIPHYYDKQIWKTGETYRIRVSNIYDPSKFWIVVKFQELDTFQTFLTNFYSKYGSFYKISMNAISINMYCVVYTDSAFYRGIIVSVPPSLTLEKKAVVFLFDYGYTSMIDLNDLYYLAEKFYNVPRFAVRASLSYLQPYDKPIWNYDVIKRFSELVLDKSLLCILDCTDVKRKIVDITLGRINEFCSVTTIGDILINEKLAKRLGTKKESILKNTTVGRYIPKTKYPHLFPVFEAIEEGVVPSSVYCSEILTQCVARDVLFKPYFAYKGTFNK